MAILQRITLNDAVMSNLPEFAYNITMDLKWVAGVTEMTKSSAVEGNATCAGFNSVAKAVDGLLSTVALYLIAMGSVLTVHMLYLLRMYLRARRAVAKVGSAEPPGAQPEAPKKAFGLYAAFCGDPSFSVFKLWPVPEVLVTLQFLSGLMSTSIKSLSAAVYAECCVPFACWLPILVLLYILCFILYIANKLRKFAVSCAPHVAIPAAERTAASGAFRTETASTPAERARVDRERTRKISLDPFRFGAVGEMEVTLGVTTFAAKLTRKASMTRKKARVGDVGQRSRVARPGSPGQESGFASPPPSPPSGTTIANPVQQAMDAAYALYYIWIGDARPGCERYALVAVVHSLVIVLVQSTCPLCGGSSSTNVQLTIVLVLQLVAIVAYLKVRPTAIGCSSVTLGITWLLEACATACYMSLPKPGDHPGFNMAELSAEFTPSPYLPPPPSAPPPPNSPPPPGAPPDPPFFPPPPAAPPPLFPLPCTSQWEAMCAQVASNISALVYTVTGDAVNLNEICSATSSDNCSVEPPSFSLGDLGFAFQLASTGITWSLLIILPSWPKIAPYLPKSTPKKEAPVEPPKEVKVKEAKKPKEEKSKEAKPPKEEKPKKVKKVKKVASAATLVEVAKEADQKLAQLGLTKVQVDLMARRLTLAESLEFQGSKSEGGAGAFKDHDAAHKVCHEVAIALKTCNDILRERGFATFGLSVEGHTSADLGDARHNSMLRASSTKEAIGSALLKMEGHDRGVKKLKAVGHGASKPLAGLDDGGNHSANRRVEIHITEEIEEEEVDEEAVESAVEAEMRGRIEEIRGGKQTEAAQSKRGTCLGCVLM